LKRKYVLAYVSLVAILLSIIAVQASTPTTTFYISNGPYPGTPKYVCWVEGSNYFAKNYTGQIVYEGTVASTMLNSLFANAANVFMRSGTYLLTAPITIPSYSQLSGESADLTILKASVNIFTDGAHAMLNLTGASWVYIADLELNGQASAWGAITSKGVGVKTSTAYYNTVVERIHFYDFSEGLEAGNGPLTVRNCKFDQIDDYLGTGEGYALFIDGGSMVRIYDNCITSPTENGIYFDCEGGTIRDNYIATELDGIDIYSSNVFCENNDLRYANSLGTGNIIYVSGSASNVTVKRNLGFPTESQGLATISSSTSVAFNHTLKSNPTLVLCSFNDTAIDGWKWTATATQITITVTPSGSYQIYWYAEYKP